MDMIPVLVKPLIRPDLDIGELKRCYNCGSNLFRFVEKWGLLSPEYIKDTGYPRAVGIVDVEIYCAVCGEFNLGYELIPSKDVVHIFETELDARIAEQLLDEDEELKQYYLGTMKESLKEYLNKVVGPDNKYKEMRE